MVHHRPSFLCTWMAASGCLLVALGPVPAQAAEPAAALSFRRILVPADRAEDWPAVEQRFLPIATDEWARLAHVAHQIAAGAPADDQPLLTDATYSARLDGAVLVEGKARLRVVHRASQASVLALDPCALAIAQASWDNEPDRPAVVGTFTGRGLGVLVDRSGTLELAWSLQARRDTGAETEFRLELPESPTKRLQIELPHGAVPVADSGHASRLPGAGRDSDLWQIELGSHNELTLGIVSESAAARWQRLPRARQLLTYDITPRGVELSGQWMLSRLREPVRHITFAVDPSVQVVTARVGDTEVPWSVSRDASAGRAQVTVEPAGPIRGADRIVRLAGLAPLVTDRLWHLPEVRCEAVAWESGIVRLLVTEPLVLKQLELSACQQIKSEPIKSPRAGESIELEAFSPAAAVEVRVARPATQLQVRTGTTLTVGILETTGRVVADCETTGSDSHTLTAQTATGWIVEAVESDPPAALANWVVEQSDGRPPRLEVQLVKALSPIDPVRLIITGRLQRSALGQQIPIDDLRMLRFVDAGDAPSLMLVRAVEPFKLHVAGDDQLKLRNPAELPAEQASLVDDPRRDLLFTMDWSATPLTVSVVRETPRFSGEIQIDATVVGRSLEESYVFRCVPESAHIQRVLVHFARPPESPRRFTFGGEGDRELAARELDADQPTGMGPGTGGQLWEVTLPRPQSGPFELRTVCVTTLLRPTQVNIASLPDAAAQRGRILVRSTAAHDVAIEHRGLQPVPTETAAPGTYSPVRAVFRYEPAQSAFATADPVLTVSPATTSREQPLAWIWHFAVDSRCAADGVTVHMARYCIENHGRRSAPWTMPEGTTLKSARVDGIRIPFASLDSSPRQHRLDFPPGRRFPELVLEFVSRDGPLGVVGTRQPKLPRSDMPVVASCWRLWLPPGYEVARGGPPARRTAATWRQRLFGPLARAAGTRPFDLLRAGDWASLRDPEPRYRRAERTAQLFLERIATAVRRSPQGAPTTWETVFAEAVAGTPMPVPLMVDRAAVARVGVTPVSPLPVTARNLPQCRCDPLPAASLLQRSELALVTHPRAVVLTSTHEAATHSPASETAGGGVHCRRIPATRRLDIEGLAETPDESSLVPMAQWLTEPEVPVPPWAERPSELSPAPGWQGTEWEDPETTAITARIIHRNSARMCGMFVFLVTAAVTCRWLGGRPAVFLALLGASGVAALALPAEYAGQATGAFLGTVAGLVSRWLRPASGQGTDDDVAVVPQRTAGGPATVALLAGLFTALAPSCGRADEARPIGPDPAPHAAVQPPLRPSDRVHEVLIPVDEQRHPLGKYVYLSESFLNALYQRDAAASHRPRLWALTGATYRATVSRGSVPRRPVVDAVTAVFDLAVFDRATPIAIPFHAENGTWIPDQVRLDGQPTKATWTPDGSALTWHVDEPGSYRLAVSMRPSRPAAGSPTGFTLAIPELATSRLELHVPDDLDNLDDLRLPANGGLIERDRRTGLVVVHLGPTTSLSVGWTAREDGQAAGADIEVAEMLWLHIRPGAAVLQAKFAVNVRYGQLHALNLITDPRLRLLPLGPDTSIEAATVEPGTLQRVGLKLKQPTARPVTIATSWLVTGYSGVGDLRLPFVRAEANQTSKRLLAVSVDTAFAYRENRRELLTALAVPDFAQAWGDETAKPLFAYELPPREPMWSLATRPREVPMTADQKLEVRVGHGAADVCLTAHMAAADGYRFQYRLLAAPELIVTDCSVRQEGVERAVHWARDDTGQITVFVADPVAAQTVVSVRGRLPTPVEGRFPLPVVTLATTQVTGGQVHVYRHDSVLVEVVDVVGLEAVPREDGPPDDLHRGRAVASFATGKSSVRATLVVAPNQPRVTGAAVTTVRWAANTWNADFDYCFRVAEGRVDEIRLEVPAWWDGPYQVDPPMALNAIDMPGGTCRRLVLHPREAIAGECRLHVAAPLKAAGDERLRVPLIVPLGAREVERFLVLPTRWESQQLAWNTRGLWPAELPAGIVTLDGPRHAPRVVRIVGEQFTAVPRTVAEVSTVPQVRLADIRLVAGAAGSGHGVATFDLLPAGLAECMLVLPDTCHLTQVAVEGAPGRVARVDTRDRRWRVMLSSTTLPQRIDVLFAAAATGQKTWGSSREWLAPALHDTGGAIDVGQTLWTLHTPQSRHGDAVTGATPISSGRQESVRFENVASLLNLPREIADDVPDGERVRWASGWVRRLLVSRGQFLRDTGRHTDGQVALVRVQALVARQVDSIGKPGAGASFDDVTNDAGAIREPAELLTWTVPRDVQTSRFIYPGAQPSFVAPDRQRFLSGQGGRLAAAGLLGLLVSFLLIAVRRGWCRDTLWQWPQLLAVAAGLAWWLWLAPSLIGWALVALAALCTYCRRRPRHEHRDRAGNEGRWVDLS